jgi:anti-sigma B factor antagonist
MIQAPRTGSSDLASVTVIYRLCRPSVRGPELDRVCEQFLPVARKGPCTLVLDFAEVTFLTAAALGRLVTLHGVLRTAGGRLFLTNLSPLLLEIFEVTGLDAVLDIGQALSEEPEGNIPCPAIGTCGPQWGTAALR